MEAGSSDLVLLRTVSARGYHPNVLIVCDDQHADSAVARVTRWSPQPVHRCAPTDWSLPDQPGGTLVVRNLDGLSASQQQALFAWMDHVGSDTQVVSAVGPGLDPWAEDGTFSEALFFRLNIVRIEVSGRCPPS